MKKPCSTVKNKSHLKQISSTVSSQSSNSEISSSSVSSYDKENIISYCYYSRDFPVLVPTKDHIEKFNKLQGKYFGYEKLKKIKCKKLYRKEHVGSRDPFHSRDLNIPLELFLISEPSENGKPSKDEMYVIENIVLNNLITHEDRAFITEAEYKMEVDGVVSSRKPSMLLYSKNYLKKIYPETKYLSLTNEQRLKGGLMVIKKKIRIKDNEIGKSESKGIFSQIGDILRDLLVVNVERQFAYGICSDLNKFILIRIERRRWDRTNPFDFALYKMKEIKYEDNGLWWLHELLNQPIHFYGVTTPFESEYIPRGIDVNDGTTLECANANKEKIKKPKSGGSGTVHILKDKSGNLYCAKEFRISQFNTLINECQKICLFRLLTMIKKKIEKTKHTPHPFILNMKNLIDLLREISTQNIDSNKSSSSSSFSSSEEEEEEKEEKKEEEEIFKEVLKNIKIKEKNLEKKRIEKVSVNGSDCEYVSTMLMEVLNENDCVDKIAEHVPTIMGMYAFGYSYFLLMKHSGNMISKPEKHSEIKKPLVLDSNKTNDNNNDSNNNNNNNNVDDVSAYIDLLPVLCAMDIFQVVHRDIRQANVVQDKEGKMTLIDFGCSCYAKESVSFAGGLHCASPYVLEMLTSHKTKFEVCCEDDLISWVRFFILLGNEDLQKRFDSIIRSDNVIYMALSFRCFWTDVEIFPKIRRLFSVKKEEIELKAEDIWYIWKVLPQFMLFEPIHKEDDVRDNKALKILKGPFLTLLILYEKIKNFSLKSVNLEDIFELLDHFNSMDMLNDKYLSPLVVRYYSHFIWNI
jgi:hypothetical protein